MILTLWNVELLTDATSIYIASECSIVIVLCWLVGGALLLRKGQAQMQKWRSLEENATDSGYLKRKEEQYERLYYRMSRNPEMAVPKELIEEMQHLV